MSMKEMMGEMMRGSRMPGMPGDPADPPAKPNPKAPLGAGGRFAAIEQKVAASGARNPAAVAAAAGRAKYGAKRMAAMAAKGRR